MKVVKHTTPAFLAAEEKVVSQSQDEGCKVRWEEYDVLDTSEQHQ